MAMVILGGIISATLLNLLVVPSLYLRFAKSVSASRSFQGVEQHAAS